MMATRESKSALLKSRIDNLEYRLKELERQSAETREALDQLRRQAEVTPSALIPTTFSAPPAPRPPVVRRPCVITARPKKVKVVRAHTGKSTKFTPEVCALIPQWLEEGLSREQIAERVGCSMNSLQVSCSKRGISLWAKNRVRHQEVELVYEGEEAA
jgi:hypothetical protein